MSTHSDNEIPGTPTLFLTVELIGAVSELLNQIAVSESVLGVAPATDAVDYVRWYVKRAYRTSRSSLVRELVEALHRSEFQQTVVDVIDWLKTSDDERARSIRATAERMRYPAGPSGHAGEADFGRIYRSAQLVSPPEQVPLAPRCP